MAEVYARDYQKYDVVGIAEAIVDIIIQTTKKEIRNFGYAHAAMTLIDENEADKLFAWMKQPQIIPGGSVANSLDIIARLGGKSAIFGTVGSDKLGRFLLDNWSERHIDHFIQKQPKPYTGRVHVLIDENGERSFATFFGLCGDIHPYHIDDNIIKNSRFLMSEGYLWDAALCRKTYFDVAKRIKSNRWPTKIALTLADPFVIERNYEEIFDFIQNYCHILFCNETELKALMRKASLDDIGEFIERLDVTLALTLAEEGARIIHHGRDIVIPTRKIKDVVDATGAGDSWCGGMLYGLCQGFSLEKSAELGHDCAAYIIQQIGARPSCSFDKIKEKYNLK